MKDKSNCTESFFTSSITSLNISSAGNWTGLVDEQLHPDPLKVPARPGGGQEGGGHGDDSSEAVLAGKLLEWKTLAYGCYK